MFLKFLLNLVANGGVVTGDETLNLNIVKLRLFFCFSEEKGNRVHQKVFDGEKEGENEGEREEE